MNMLERWVPAEFGRFLAVVDGEAVFSSGILLEPRHPNPWAPPEPWDSAVAGGARIGMPGPDDLLAWHRMEHTWVCGAAVFSRIVEDLEDARDSERRRRRPEADSLVREAHDHANPSDGPLTPETAANLGHASKATIYRLLTYHPAEIMLGEKRRCPRWTNRASFEKWFAEASKLRRDATSALPIVATANRPQRNAATEIPAEESPLAEVRRRLVEKRP